MPASATCTHRWTTRWTKKAARSGPDATIVSILHDHLAGRVPLVAAGRLKTPPQAASALEHGLSLVAVGHGLVINPDWVADARTGSNADIHVAISAADVAPACIAHKLWAVIDAARGWLNVLAPTTA